MRMDKCKGLWNFSGGSEQLQTMMVMTIAVIQEERPCQVEGCSAKAYREDERPGRRGG